MMVMVIMRFMLIFVTLILVFISLIMMFMFHNYFDLSYFLSLVKNHLSPTKTKLMDTTAIIIKKRSDFTFIHKNAVNTIKSNKRAVKRINPFALTSFLKCLNTPQ